MITKNIKITLIIFTLILGFTKKGFADEQLELLTFSQNEISTLYNRFTQGQISLSTGSMQVIGQCKRAVLSSKGIWYVACKSHGNSNYLIKSSEPSVPSDFIELNTFLNDRDRSRMYRYYVRSKALESEDPNSKYFETLLSRQLQVLVQLDKDKSIKDSIKNDLKIRIGSQLLRLLGNNKQRFDKMVNKNNEVANLLKKSVQMYQADNAQKYIRYRNKNHTVNFIEGKDWQLLPIPEKTPDNKKINFDFHLYQSKDLTIMKVPVTVKEKYMTSDEINQVYKREKR